MSEPPENQSIKAFYLGDGRWLALSNCYKTYCPVMEKCKNILMGNIRLWDVLQKNELSDQEKIDLFKGDGE